MALVTVPEWLCWAVVSQFFVTVAAGGVLAWRLGRLAAAVDRLTARRDQPQESEGW